MIESLPGVVYQYQQWEDGRSQFNYCSEAVEKLLFVSADEILKDGARAWRHVTPEYLTPISDALAESAFSSTRMDISFQVSGPEGGEKSWVRNRATPEIQDDGSMVWYGHMVDISEKVAADEERKRKDSLLRELFKNLPDYIYYKDADGRFVDANPACCRHHGRRVEELIGVTDLELYPDEVGKEYFAKEQQLMKDRSIFHEREAQVGPDGEPIYLDTVKCPLLSTSGRLLGLAGISRVVTAEVENERALELARQEAEVSAGVIQALFDNLEDQLYYKDCDSRVLGGNAAWFKVRGVESIDALIGKTDLDLHPLPLGRELYEAEQRLIQSGKTSRVREKHILNKGQTAYFESIKCPMRNETGEIIGLAGISRDVTAQVADEQALIEARQAADDANMAKSMFLAMMSHEIRTPMNGIVGAASLLEGTELSSLQKEFVRTIEVSGENLLTLINDILDYSKIEAGKIVLENISFILRECIEDSFDLFVQTAAKKNVELLYHIDAALPSLFKGDPTRLRQVIINLVGNAVKFTEAGEIVLRVDLIDFLEAEGLCRMKISVRDTGAGIPKEVQGNLFKAFTQAQLSDTRKYGGTGLGLTISRRLIELMGGTISFESTEGEGSTFFFDLILPVADEHQFKSREEEANRLLGGKRILIVEDNESNRQKLIDELHAWGIEVAAFSTSEEALDCLKQGQEFDLALIDFKMPVMDGRELANEIHEQYANLKDLPVIMLSNPAEYLPEDPSINAWISKPVKHGLLRGQLLNLLAEGRVSKDEASAESTLVLPKKSYDLRILVVEDNLLNQRIIKLMLNRLGYEDAVIVPDGEDAVAAAMDSEYDVILMDIQMPGMNGLEAAREIRKWSGNAERPWILALSAGVLAEERTAAEAAGMNGFLSKPIPVQKLAQELSVIRRR
jgi:PAS domain S-box-containing protein